MTQNKPIKKYIAGGVHLAIWKNQMTTGAPDQRPQYTVTLERCYKDKSEQWKTTTTFRELDLPKASLLLSKAYEFILEQNKEPVIGYESV